MTIIKIVAIMAISMSAHSAYAIDRADEFNGFGISSNMSAEDATKKFIEMEFNDIRIKKSGMNTWDKAVSASEVYQNGRLSKPKQNKVAADGGIELVMRQTISANRTTGTKKGEVRKQLSCSLQYMGETLISFECTDRDPNYTAFPILDVIKKRLGEPDNVNERGTSLNAEWACKSSEPSEGCAVRLNAATGTFSLAFARDQGALTEIKARLDERHAELQSKAARTQRGDLKTDF